MSSEPETITFDRQCGDLYILYEVDDASPGYFWCRCSCGKDVKIWWRYLWDGTATSCGCQDEESSCAKRASQPDTPMQQLYKRYTANAKRRDLSFDLTEEQFAKLTSQPCHYCGRQPAQSIGKATEAYIYNGIDRMDNTRGYVSENCVPCCWTCNWAKGSMPYAIFLSWIEQVYQHQHYAQSAKEVSQ